MKEIYDQGLEPKGQGKSVRQFYEESRINDLGLDNVLRLDEELDRHGLRWTTQQLGKYAPFVVREFYAVHLATLHRGLPMNKKPIEQPRLWVVPV